MYILTSLVLVFYVVPSPRLTLSFIFEFIFNASFIQLDGSNWIDWCWYHHNLYHQHSIQFACCISQLMTQVSETPSLTWGDFICSLCHTSKQSKSIDKPANSRWGKYLDSFACRNTIVSMHIYSRKFLPDYGMAQTTEQVTHLSSWFTCTFVLGLRLLWRPMWFII